MTKPDEFGRIQKNNALIEWAMARIGAENDFTGQINIEINVVDGEVKDFYVSPRTREVV